jgi:hypothetical protein
MRQLVLRVVCDHCGLAMMLETMNSEPLTVTTNIQGMVERQGWQSVPKEGSSFSTHDCCPACQAVPHHKR